MCTRQEIAYLANKNLCVNTFCENGKDIILCYAAASAPAITGFNAAGFQMYKGGRERNVFVVCHVFTGACKRDGGS